MFIGRLIAFGVQIGLFVLAIPVFATILAYEYVLIVGFSYNSVHVTATVLRNLKVATWACLSIYPLCLFALRRGAFFCLASFSIVFRRDTPLHAAGLMARIIDILLTMMTWSVLGVFGLGLLPWYIPMAGIYISLAFISFVWDGCIGILGDMYMGWNKNAYSPLQPGHIRLLKVYPGTYEDDLRCVFIEAAPEVSEYEALSYTWENDVVFRRRVCIGQHAFLIPNNVYQALRHMRHLKLAKMVWIDYICINQRDVLERSNQVLNMRQVYTNAQRVVIWLGDSPRHVELAFQKCRQVALLTHDEARDAALHDGTQWQPALSKLLKHRWWSRMWVLQEIVAAQEAVVRTDHHECLWNHFKVTIQTNFKNGGNLLRIDAEIEKFLDTIDELKATRDDAESAHFHLAKAFRSRAATDGRDKVFALAGLLKDHDSLLIKPNYSLMESVVFADFTRACMTRVGHLGVLALSEQMRDFLDISWAVDWQTERYTKNRVPLWTGDLYPSRLSLPTYRADGGIPLSIQDQNESRGSLVLRGIKLDWIYGVGVKCPDALKSLAGEGAILATTISAWAEAFGQFYADPGVFARCLSCTLMCDQDAVGEVDWQRCLPSSAMFRTIIASIGGSDMDPYELSRLTSFYDTPEPAAPSPDLEPEQYRQYRLLHCCRNRRMFITSTGRLGLGPDNLKPDDVIALVFGSAVPLILRPQKSWVRKNPLARYTFSQSLPESGQEVYTFVGQAYVHGLMHWDGDIDNACYNEQRVYPEWLHII